MGVPHEGLEQILQRSAAKVRTSKVIAGNMHNVGTIHNLTLVAGPWSEG